MKYAVHLTNEKGKRVTLAGNEHIDIDIMDGSKRIAALTVRPNGDDPHEAAAVYDENDIPLRDTATCKHCQEPLYTAIRAHHHTENGQDVTQ